jgi:SEC-C motif-containing protein
MAKCPCGSKKSYKKCCGPVISGSKNAETAEALMKARYTAYVNTEIDFLYNTISNSQKKDFKRQDAIDWSQNSKWEGLEILETKDGGPDDEKGTVEFIASFKQNDDDIRHHEIATFEKIGGNWTFMNGKTPKAKQARRESPKIGRNEPCPCGSGKKYKKCCGR